VPAEPAPGRIPRTTLIAGRSAWAAGSAMITVARLVRLITGLVVLVIAIAIVLRVAGANPSNSVVSGFHDAGKWLVWPFRNVFTIHNAKGNLAANWGLAAVVYLIAGSLIAGLIGHSAPRGLPPRRTRIGAVA
jgi:hypothetical protein